MPDITLVVAALFLPVFPLSMVFNALFNALPHALLRCVLLLLWPQIGLALLNTTSSAIPAWLITCALASSLLYSFRLLTLREVGQWTGFLATSLWALLWLTPGHADEKALSHLHALGMTAPLVLLVLLTAALEKRFGAAYAGLYGGLAQTLPRFAGVFVVVVLASVATPLFPAFFTLLEMIVHTSVTMPLLALMLLVTWLLWSWAGARLIQGMIAGPDNGVETDDLGVLTTWACAIILLFLIAGSIYLSGELL